MTERTSFGSKHPESVEFFSFNFGSRLSTGETIVDVTFTIEVTRGQDPDVASMLTGSPVISGSRVSQLVSFGLVGRVYELKALAETSEGQFLPACGYFTVESC